MKHILIYLLSIIFITGCVTMPNTNSVPQKIDFNLKYNLNSQTVFEIDSAKSIYMSNTIPGNQNQRSISLSDEQKIKIYNEFKRLNIEKLDLEQSSLTVNCVESVEKQLTFNFDDNRFDYKWGCALGFESIELNNMYEFIQEQSNVKFGSSPIYKIE